MNVQEIQRGKAIVSERLLERLREARAEAGISETPRRRRRSADDALIERVVRSISPFSVVDVDQHAGVVINLVLDAMSR